MKAVSIGPIQGRDQSLTMFFTDGHDEGADLSHPIKPTNLSAPSFHDDDVNMYLWSFGLDFTRVCPSGTLLTCSEIYSGAAFPAGFNKKRLSGFVDGLVKAGMLRRTGRYVPSPRIVGNPGLGAEYEVM